MVGDSDDVLFHAVPLLSNGILLVQLLFVAEMVVPPVCSDVDIADGTYAVDAGEWTLNEVPPIADALPAAVLRWFWICVLFNEVDIRFDVKLLADDAVVAVTLAAAVVGNTWRLGDFGEFDADSDMFWLFSA